MIISVLCLLPARLLEGFQNSTTSADLGLCGSLLLVYEGAEDWPALDLLLGEVGKLGWQGGRVGGCGGGAPVVVRLYVPRISSIALTSTDE
jgi:hypothetical protein